MCDCVFGVSVFDMHNTWVDDMYNIYIFVFVLFYIFVYIGLCIFRTLISCLCVCVCIFSNGGRVDGGNIGNYGEANNHINTRAKSTGNHNAHLYLC